MTEEFRKPSAPMSANEHQLLAEVRQLRAENERLRAERDELVDALRAALGENLDVVRGWKPRAWALIARIENVVPAEGR